jgi:hypothetical protein
LSQKIRISGLDGWRNGDLRMEIVFQQIDDKELEKRLQKAATGKPADAKEFFAQLEYEFHYANGNYLGAYEKAISVLQKLKKLDSKAYSRIHKGRPFYFTGISSFVLFNYAHATYFFDAAVSEDLSNDPKKRTPAIMFIELDGDPDEQAAKQLTQIAEKTLSEYITSYNTVPGALPITMDEVRSKFFSKSVKDMLGWRTLSTALISFLLEAGHLVKLQDIRMQDGTSELFFIHLLKGCVLFESLLKINTKAKLGTKATLGKIIRDPEIMRLMNIKENYEWSADSLIDVLSKLPVAFDNIKTQIEIAAQLRNKIGHNIGWTTQMNSDQYNQLVSILMNSILHTISSLY